MSGYAISTIEYCISGVDRRVSGNGRRGGMCASAPNHHGLIVNLQINDLILYILEIDL